MLLRGVQAQVVQEDLGPVLGRPVRDDLVLVQVGLVFGGVVYRKVVKAGNERVSLLFYFLLTFQKVRF